MLPQKFQLYTALTVVVQVVSRNGDTQQVGKSSVSKLMPNKTKQQLFRGGTQLVTFGAGVTINAGTSIVSFSRLDLNDG